MKSSESDLMTLVAQIEEVTSPNLHLISSDLEIGKKGA